MDEVARPRRHAKLEKNFKNVQSVATKKKIIIIIPDRLVEGRKNRELIEFIIRFIFSLLMKWNLDDIYGALYIYIYMKLSKVVRLLSGTGQ